MTANPPIDSPFSGAACPLYVRPFLPFCWLVPLTLLCGAAAAADNDPAVRRERVQNLPLSEQQQLLRNQQRFAELSADEQQQLRALHEELTSDPNSARLRGVLERYHEWLKTLSAEQRAELNDLTPDERIARIERLMSRQRDERERGRRRYFGNQPPLAREDARQVFHWFGDLVWRKRAELLKEIPAERREQVERLDEPLQRRSLMWTAMQRWRGEPLPAAPEQLAELTQKLSPPAQARFAEAETPEQQGRLVRDWLAQSMMMRMGPFGSRRSMAAASSEELERFFQRHLSEDERSRLMNLPRDEMREELRHLYLQRGAGPDRGRADRGRGRPPRRGPGGPNGPGRGRPGGRGDHDRPEQDGPGQDRPDQERP